MEAMITDLAKENLEEAWEGLTPKDKENCKRILRKLLQNIRNR
jgi:hypothetical protein